LLASSAVIAGIVDSDNTLVGTKLLGVPVLGGDKLVEDFPPSEILLVNGLGSVGLPLRRQQLFEQFLTAGYAFASVIHPSAVVASNVELGEGSQIMAGSVIQPGSRIGCNVIINTRTSVDHDCIVCDHTHIAPGVTLSGGVRVGISCHIGTGATVIQNVCIGEKCLVGAGSLVLRDVLPGVTVLGAPAKVVNRCI